MHSLSKQTPRITIVQDQGLSINHSAIHLIDVLILSFPLPSPRTTVSSPYSFSAPHAQTRYSHLHIESQNLLF